MAKNSKQSTAQMTSVAARMMQSAKGGGPIAANREALRLALQEAERIDEPVPVASDSKLADATADRLLDAVQGVLKPYFDDAESLAASVMSQARSE